MSQTISPVSDAMRQAVRNVFAVGGPVLVEVRFPGTATSSDWHLCDEDEDFDRLLEKLGAGAELHCSRVWDLTNHRGAVCMRR